MSGIVFFKTEMLEKLTKFYTKEIGCRIWLQQEDCTLLKHGNLLFGFCQRDKADTDSLITFFFDSREEVDQFYTRFKDTAKSPPALSDKYNIYQFFAEDPEGRMLEFQYFNHHIAEFRAADELLVTRRSIRHFKDEAISDELINKVLDISRFAPTSRNTQGYYFKLIREKDILNKLSVVRGSSTAPIGRAPMAVAVCSDPGITKRHIQDGCIAAYHFILAAWYFGLGTCWIAAMDREDAKVALGVPSEHYIATVTPLGYPAKEPETPERRPAGEMVRYIG